MVQHKVHLESSVKKGAILWCIWKAQSYGVLASGYPIEW